jgi:hypothetical protein
MSKSTLRRETSVVDSLDHNFSYGVISAGEVLCRHCRAERKQRHQRRTVVAKWHGVLPSSSTQFKFTPSDRSNGSADAAAPNATLSSITLVSAPASINNRIIAPACSFARAARSNIVLPSLLRRSISAPCSSTSFRLSTRPALSRHVTGTVALVVAQIHVGAGIDQTWQHITKPLSQFRRGKVQNSRSILTFHAHICAGAD